MKGENRIISMISVFVFFLALPSFAYSGDPDGSCKETVKSLEDKIQHLFDIHEVQNLMSNYAYLHAAGMHDETVALFAQHTPGVRLENFNRGIFDGIESVRRFYMGVKEIEGDRIGHLHLHTLTTPAIEVAGDGKTAQAIWISPGVETMPENGEISAMWAWIKYGADFIKEDGKWKIWHLHMYHIFSTPYNRSWADKDPTPKKSHPGNIKADRPISYSWEYSPDVAPENVPAPPTPYDTCDESRSYVP